MATRPLIQLGGGKKTARKDFPIGSTFGFSSSSAAVRKMRKASPKPKIPKRHIASRQPRALTTELRGPPPKEAPSMAIELATPIRRARFFMLNRWDEMYTIATKAKAEPRPIKKRPPAARVRVGDRLKRSDPAPQRRAARGRRRLMPYRSEE